MDKNKTKINNMDINKTKINNIQCKFGSKLQIQPTNYHLLAAQQEPYKKVISEQQVLENFLG